MMARECDKDDKFTLLDIVYTSTFPQSHARPYISFILIHKILDQIPCVVTLVARIPSQSSDIFLLTGGFSVILHFIQKIKRKLLTPICQQNETMNFEIDFNQSSDSCFWKCMHIIAFIMFENIRNAKCVLQHYVHIPCMQKCSVLSWVFLITFESKTKKQSYNYLH